MSQHADVQHTGAARNVKHVGSPKQEATTMEAVIFEDSPTAHYLEGESLIVLRAQKLTRI